MFVNQSRKAFIKIISSLQAKFRILYKTFPIWAILHNKKCFSSLLFVSGCFIWWSVVNRSEGLDQSLFTLKAFWKLTKLTFVRRNIAIDSSKITKYMRNDFLSYQTTMMTNKLKFRKVTLIMAILSYLLMWQDDCSLLRAFLWQLKTVYDKKTDKHASHTPAKQRRI